MFGATKFVPFFFHHLAQPIEAQFYPGVRHIYGWGYNQRQKKPKEGKMKKQRQWDELYQQASHEIQQWRQAHKKATLTEIENTVDAELAKMRAQMIEDLALASEVANLKDVPVEKRPHCPACSVSLSANGKQKRQLVTEHEQAVNLSRSQGVCPQCGTSSFPPG